MKIDITIEDYGIIINALHYYKKVEKKGNFQQYDDERINSLRDKVVLYCIEKPQLCKEEYANIKTQNKINNYQKPEIK